MHASNDGPWELEIEEEKSLGLALVVWMSVSVCIFSRELMVSFFVHQRLPTACMAMYAVTARPTPTAPTSPQGKPLPGTFSSSMNSCSRLSAILALEKLLLTRVRAFSPIFCSRKSSISNRARRKTSVHASAFRGRSQPVSPSTIDSNGPPVDVARTGICGVQHRSEPSILSNLLLQVRPQEARCQSVRSRVCRGEESKS